MESEGGEATRALQAAGNCATIESLLSEVEVSRQSRGRPIECVVSGVNAVPDCCRACLQHAFLALWLAYNTVSTYPGPSSVHACTGLIHVVMRALAVRCWRGAGTPTSSRCWPCVSRRRACAWCVAVVVAAETVTVVSFHGGTPMPSYPST